MNTRSAPASRSCSSSCVCASMPTASMLLRNSDSSTAAPLSREISRSAEQPPITTATRPYFSADQSLCILHPLYCQLPAQGANIARTLHQQNVSVMQYIIENTAQLFGLFDQYRIQLATLPNAATQVATVGTTNGLLARGVHVQHQEE